MDIRIFQPSELSLGGNKLEHRFVRREKKAAVFSARFTEHGPETQTEHAKYSSSRKNRSCDL